MAEVVEYAVRWTGWINTTGIDRQIVKYELCGHGKPGLDVARSLVSDTRAWQGRQRLPVDAVVVSRPVLEWAIYEEPKGEHDGA